MPLKEPHPTHDDISEWFLDQYLPFEEIDIGNNVCQKCLKVTSSSDRTNLWCSAAASAILDLMEHLCSASSAKNLMKEQILQIMDVYIVTSLQGSFHRFYKIIHNLIDDRRWDVNPPLGNQCEAESSELFPLQDRGKPHIINGGPHNRFQSCDANWTSTWVPL